MKIHLFIENNINFKDNLILKKIKRGYNSLNNNEINSEINIYRINSENLINLLDKEFSYSILVFSVICMDLFDKIKNILNELKTSDCRLIFLYNPEMVIDEIYNYCDNLSKNKNITIYSSKLLIDNDSSNSLIFSLFEKFHKNYYSIKFIKNEKRLKNYDIATEIHKARIKLIYTYDIAYNYLFNLQESKGYAKWKNKEIVCFNKKGKFMKCFLIPMEPETIKSLGLIFSKDNGVTWEFLFNKKYILDDYRLKSDIIMMTGYLLNNEI